MFAIEDWLWPLKKVAVIEVWLVLNNNWHIHKKIIPSEESEGISLTLKTTNIKHVDFHVTLNTGYSCFKIIYYCKILLRTVFVCINFN